jgi:hypothetical protein
MFYASFCTVIHLWNNYNMSNFSLMLIGSYVESLRQKIKLSVQFYLYTSIPIP